MTQCLNLCKKDGSPGGLPHSATKVLPPSSCAPITNHKEASQCWTLSLGICRRKSSSGKHQTHFSDLSTTKHPRSSMEDSDPLQIASEIFACDNVYGTSDKNITVFVYENSSVLSSTRSYTKQPTLSPDVWDCMPWRKCVADV